MCRVCVARVAAALGRPQQAARWLAWRFRALRAPFNAPSALLEPTGRYAPSPIRVRSDNEPTGRISLN